MVVLEKGGHYEAADFREWTESEAFGRAYDQGIIIYIEYNCKYIRYRYR